MKSYTVIYRTGGRENFEWKKTLPFSQKEEAEKARNEIIQGGRRALIFETDKINEIGLPETWE